MVQKLGIGEKVKFMGIISYKDMPIYYNAADVFVLPSFFESFPLVCLEAAACSIPIVISKAARAFIEDFGKNHLFIFDPKNIDSIYHGIINALNENISDEKVLLANNKIKEYDWLNRATKVEMIYKMVLNNDPNPSLT